jgi:hypothetical protein
MRNVTIIRLVGGNRAAADVPLRSQREAILPQDNAGTATSEPNDPRFSTIDFATTRLPGNPSDRC